MISQLKQIWRGFENKLKKFFEFIIFSLLPQKKSYKLATVVFVLVGILFVGSYVFAAPSQGLLDTVLDLLNVVLLIIVEMLGWVLMKIFAVVIIISSYNSFVTNPAVVKGWVLVRDICNLFFVLILLLIAFAQIFQVEKYSLKTLLPKLLMAAILVNFSKLIAGLIIDFGQVVMMTFVNGYAATAGANLVNGLGLAKLLALKDTSDLGTPDSTSIFIALFVAIFVLIISIVIVFFILLLLLLRIVYLWILVVLSPIAFVFPAIPIAGLQGKASEWWKKFGWAVAVGPLMAFFLWLSLMVMSNPDETISKSYEQVEAKSVGSVVSNYTYINQLVQSAIGLAMLFGGLMVAQEAGSAMGGAFGDLANYAKKQTTSAATSLGRKMTGYGAVADRATAAYGGFTAKQGQKKAAVMAKWAGYGEKTFATKEAVLRTGKRAGALAAGVAGGVVFAGAKKIPGAKYVGKASEKISDIKNKIAGKMGGVMSNNETIKSMKTAWAGTAHVGGMNLVAETAINQDQYKTAMAQGRDLLNARRIKDPKELLKAMNSNDEDRNLRKAAALELAEKGLMPNADDAQTAFDLMKGDVASGKGLEESLLKKQAHLAIGNKGLDSHSAGHLIDMIREGAVDIGNQSAETYGNADFMEMVKEALGDKAFSGKMQDVSKKSAKHKDAIAKSLTKMAVQRAQSGTTEGGEDFRKALANVTGNLNEAYGQRGADGQLVTTGTAGAVPFDASLAVEFKKFVKSLSGKQLAGMDIKDHSVSELAKNISPQQLANMSASDESGASDKIGLIVEEMLKQATADGGNTETIARVAGNQMIMGNLDKSIAAKIQGIVDKVKSDADAVVVTAKATA
ncbi:MAG: hypothetical protein AAB766_02165, partial [Patescibacteria group bacterium]